MNQQRSGERKDTLCLLPAFGGFPEFIPPSGVPLKAAGI